MVKLSYHSYLVLSVVALWCLRDLAHSQLAREFVQQPGRTIFASAGWTWMYYQCVRAISLRPSFVTTTDIWVDGLSRSEEGLRKTSRTTTMPASRKENARHAAMPVTASDSTRDAA